MQLSQNCIYEIGTVGPLLFSIILFYCSYFYNSISKPFTVIVIIVEFLAVLSMSFQAKYYSFLKCPRAISHKTYLYKVPVMAMNF